MRRWHSGFAEGNAKPWNKAELLMWIIAPRAAHWTFGASVTTGLHKWDTVCIFPVSPWDYGHNVGVLLVYVYGTFFMNLKIWSVNICFNIAFFIHLLWIYSSMWEGLCTFVLWCKINDTACMEILPVPFFVSYCLSIYLHICGSNVLVCV